VIAEEVRQQIDGWIAKFPPGRQRSALLPALLLVQEQNGGWLTEPLMDAVAEYLDLPKIAVYEVATFYDMYDLKPVGKHKIKVCTNISCMLRGSDEIVHHLEKRLAVKLGETTADGEITLKEVECMGACANAPMLQIDDRDYYEDLTPSKVDAILENLAKAGEPLAHPETIK
jgi:NADH-quinone oxidoreductase subunit E